MANREHIKIIRQGVAAWNTWRLENKDVQPDLSLVDLSRSDLRYVDFSDANLSSTTLINANLSGGYLDDANLHKASLLDADLSSTTLINANLSGGYLGKVNLSNADLSNVNLRGANLDYAHLSNANLSGVDLSYVSLDLTNFEKAICNRTIFAGLDFSIATGLETVQHDGPSTIDIDTVFQSGGKIPEIFLRGCGVPEELIRYLPSLLNQAIQFYSCFISYSHDDIAFARRLHDTLQGRGIRCWLDEKQMNPGDDIYEEIDQGIRYWDKMLLCCSESALSEKWWVDHEIDKAFQKERDIMRKRKKKVLALIPLDLDGFLLSDEYDSGKAQQIRSRIAADFKGWEHDNAIFEREIEHVIKALKLGGDKEIPPEPKL